MPVASGVEALCFAQDDKSKVWCIAAADRLPAVDVVPSFAALQILHAKQYRVIEAPACLARALGGR